jgi:acyl carrier protein
VSRTDDITSFIARELTSEITAGELATDYDLLDSGLIDSLRLLRLITWVGTTYGIDLDTVDINPDSFRSVGAIDAFVTEFESASTAHV